MLSSRSQFSRRRIAGFPAPALSLTLLTLVAAVSMGGVTTSAAAQTTSAAPEPRVSRLYPVWVGYALTAVLGLGILGVSLMPSKRAHQD